ncbi:MAG TPA: nuclear transport factor 2 family protein [Solirubrobacteraceae bacterium]|nr:nuclear transport factor 2 family protein [Solirubrobacteraceae bacterium]
MDGGHIDTVVQACAAWCQGDISVYREMYAPDVVASGGRLWPEREGSVAGADAVMANFDLLLAAFERSELIPESFVEEGDSLVVRLLWRGVLRASATRVEQRLFCAYRFREGLIVYQVWFPELAEALDAVELPACAAESLRPLQASSPLAGAAPPAAPAS